MTNQEHFDQLRAAHSASYENFLKMERSMTESGFADIFNAPHYQKAYRDCYEKSYAVELFRSYWESNKDLNPEDEYTGFADPNRDDDDLRDRMLGR